MFAGGGFGVGLTVADLRSRPPEVCPPEGVDPAALLPAGVSQRRSRLGEVLPPAWRSDAELAAELERLVQIEAQVAAYRAELVVELAARRPNCLDVPAGQPGAAAPVDADGRPELIDTGTSEFFCDELALILNCSRATATTLTNQAHTLLESLPATWAALADGILDWPRARTIAAELGEPAVDTDPTVVADVQAAILPRAANMSIRALQAAIRRELFARDPAAAERRCRQAEKLADVTVHRLRDGMAELAAFAGADRVTALWETVNALAQQAKADGDRRPLGQLRMEALEALVLRPWDPSREPVTANLTVLAPLWTLFPDAGLPPGCATGSDAAFAGERLPHQHPVGYRPDGIPGIAPAQGSATASAPAAAVGTMRPTAPAAAPAEVNGQPITAAQLRALLESLDALCPGGLQAPAGGTLSIALVDPDGTLRAVTDRRELERLARRGCPHHPTGSPGGGDCGCAVLDRPPRIDRYEPTPAQRRFVKTRDRTCRHPGCSNRAGWADLDHVIPHAEGGDTDCGNLCCSCRRHHRLKTKARGWRFTMSDDGVLTVTTPSGVTRTTRPPGLSEAADLTETEPAPDDDPPPY